MTNLDEPTYRAAWFYYHDNLTQQEISEILGTSRATVGRLLERARKLGIVKITVDPGLQHVYVVRSELIRRFGLDDAVVVSTASEDARGRMQVDQSLAIACGQFLEARLQPGDLLAIGWGNTVSRALLELSQGVLDQTRVITLTGGVDPYLRAQVDKPNLRPLGNRGVANLIPAPLLASSPTLAQALMDESEVRQQLDQALIADHVLVGIGSTASNPTLTELGYLTADDLAKYAAMGIVGDMLGRFIYADGSEADLPIHKRIIGTDLNQLRKMRNVIGLAGGQHKVAAVTAVLRGRYLNVLITDTETASAVLNHDAENSV